MTISQWYLKFHKKAGFFKNVKKDKQNIKIENMKLLRINLTVDEQNVLIKSKRTAMIIIKVILAWCVIIVGYELYLQ